MGIPTIKGHRGPLEQCVYCGSEKIVEDKKFSDKFYICYDCEQCGKTFEVQRKEPKCDS